MKIGLVQTKHNALYDFLNPEFTLTSDQCRFLQEQQVRQNLQLLQQAERREFDLLVTTECINYIRTAGSNRAEDALLYPTLDCWEREALSRAARCAGSWLVAGLGYRENGKAYNAALVFDRKGELRQIYRKAHLVGDESKVFTPGNALCVQQADFGCFGVCVCWDMQFPETARSLALMGAQIVVCPTWGWEADLYGRARAYENGIFAAAAMAVPAWGNIESPRTPSSVISPSGDFLVCASVDAAVLVECTLDLSQISLYHSARIDGRRPELYIGYGFDKANLRGES